MANTHSAPKFPASGFINSALPESSLIRANQSINRTIHLFYCTTRVAYVKCELVMNTLSLRVLLVDDDDDDRQLIRWALTNAIQQVVIEEMTTGQELIDWLATYRRLSPEDVAADSSFITVILLDMHMPKLTGLETLRLLGNMQDLAYMPVVMLTSSMNDQLKHQAYEQGIHLYMVKPTGPGGFHRVVEAVKLCFRDTLRMRDQLEML